MKAVFDTTILIDYLNGVSAAKEEIERFKLKAISIITYIETLIGATGNDEDIQGFLDTFEVIEVNREIADLALTARKAYKLKIPDSLVLATAQSIGALLVTRNINDFPEAIPIVRVPYRFKQDDIQTRITNLAVI